MNLQRLTLCTLITAFVLPLSVYGQTSYPMLMNLSPVAAQTGQSSEHTLESRYSMYGATQVIVSGEGVQGEILTEMTPAADGKIPALTKIQLRFSVDSKALPGVRDFRIVGPTGPSTIGQLVISPNPVIAEDRKNDTRDVAQQVELPATICGCIEKAEDVDFYRFRVAHTTRMTFHCLSMRLEDRIHDLQTHADPIIAIRNAETGSTVAAADNTFAADPFLSETLEPGDYLLEVRDVRYQGNANWYYAIEISDRPWVRTVNPLVVPRGQSARLQLIGPQFADPTFVDYQAPEGPPSGAASVQLTYETGLTNPVPVVVSELPVVGEGPEGELTAGNIQNIDWPAIVSGRIDQDADVDRFAFQARKGERISFEVLARRYASELDSVIRILGADEKVLAENDDTRLWGKRAVQDSLIEFWSPPADGQYFVEVRDVHLRGGPEFVYGLQLTRAEPDFELFLDTDKTWLAPGCCSAIFVRAVRRNGFDRDIQLHVAGLPPGVTAHCGQIAAGKLIDGCIVLEAAATAEPCAANIVVTGTASVTETKSEAEASDAADLAAEELIRVAKPMQEIYMPGGGRNHWPVDMHTVAVGSSTDIREVRLSQYEVALRPGESVRIDVELVRSEGFSKNVTLDMLFQHLNTRFADTLPPGVTIDAKSSQTLLTGSVSSGSIVLKAAADAPAVTRQQCCVMANVSINFVMKASWSSRPVLISVVRDDP